jgi:hypothetical protein
MRNGKWEMRSPAVCRVPPAPCCLPLGQPVCLLVNPSASWSTRLPPGQPVCLLVNVIRIPYFGLSVITGLSAIG